MNAHTWDHPNADPIADLRAFAERASGLNRTEGNVIYLGRAPRKAARDLLGRDITVADLAGLPVSRIVLVDEEEE